MRELGKNVKKIREDKNFTQEYIAGLLGITQSQYSRYENGHTPIKEELLYKIAEVFKLEIETILNYHELVETAIKKNNFIEIVLKDIKQMFKDSYNSKSYLDNFKCYSRFFTIPEIITKTFKSEQQIIQSIANTKDLFLRYYKSYNQLAFSDLVVVEKSFKNCDYGCCIRNRENPIWIVNPIGNHTRGINHFSFTIADNFQYNYSSLTEEILEPDYTRLIRNHSVYYHYYALGFPYDYPPILKQFLDEMLNGRKYKNIIHFNSWVFIFCSAASGRDADIIVEYGKPQNSQENDFKDSTIQYPDKFLAWKASLLHYLKKEHFTYTKSKKQFNFSYKEHLIGNNETYWLGKCIHHLTGANVVTVYINIKNLIADGDTYYTLLKCFLLAFHENFSLESNPEKS